MNASSPFRYLLILTALGVCRIAVAQSALAPSNVTMDVGRGYLVNALKTLFNQANVNYAFGGEVEAYAKGKLVTLHAHDLPFRDALETLLRQVRWGEQGLTYRLENGVWIISCREDSDFVAEQIPEPRRLDNPLTTRYVSNIKFSGSSNNVPREILSSAGVNYVLCTPESYQRTMPEIFGVLKLSSALKLLAEGDEQELQLRVVGDIASVGAGVERDAGASAGVEGGRNSLRVSVSLDSCDLTNSLTALFAAGKTKAHLLSAIHDTVTARLENVSFRTAMETLLRCEPDLTYLLENSVFSIRNKQMESPPISRYVAPAEPSISVDVENVPLGEALRAVCRSARVGLYFEDSAKYWVMQHKPVTMHTKSTTLAKAAEKLLEREDDQEIGINSYVSNSVLHVYSMLNLPKTPVNASLSDVNLDEALYEIFQQINVPYVYTVRDSQTQRFSFQFDGLPFPLALYQISRSVHAPKTCSFVTLDDLIILYTSNTYAPHPDPIPSSERFTVRTRDADVRYVLKSLFGTAGSNYTIDQAVQGTISIDLRSRTFSDAVESILRAASDSFTYRLEDKVYSIYPKVETPPVGPSPNP